MTATEWLTNRLRAEASSTLSTSEDITEASCLRLFTLIVLIRRNPHAEAQKGQLCLPF